MFAGVLRLFNACNVYDNLVITSEHNEEIGLPSKNIGTDLLVSTKNENCSQFVYEELSLLEVEPL